MGLTDKRLDVPEWAIEVKDIAMSNKWRTQYEFKNKFAAPPVVVATAMSPGGEPCGNVDVHVISVTKDAIDFSINAQIPGVYVHMHAIGKWR